MRSKKDRELLENLETAACLHGFDLVDIERTGSGRNALIRVFIDKPEGLTLDDVATANSWVSEVVEKLDPYKESYTLEVSSPGVDRPLRTMEHFEKALGEEVAIALDSALVPERDTQDGTKPRLKYTGVITQVNAEEQLITLEVDGTTHIISFTHIKKARIKGRLDFEGKKG